jgi:hypothetical protein
VRHSGRISWQEVHANENPPHRRIGAAIINVSRLSNPCNRPTPLFGAQSRASFHPCQEVPPSQPLASTVSHESMPQVANDRLHESSLALTELDKMYQNEVLSGSWPLRGCEEAARTHTTVPRPPSPRVWFCPPGAPPPPRC